MTPQQAAQALRSGCWTGPGRVTGRLDLTGFEQGTLPAGLHCYELDASGSSLRTLPGDLKVDSRLVLDDCALLESLPRGLQVGSLSLRNCVALQALPEGLSTWFLDMTACTAFQNWPSHGAIHYGALVLRGCTALTHLPGWLGRLSSLDVSGCSQLTEIPQGVEVTSWVDVGGTPIRALPTGLQGAPLRWKGVRVDERIAFRPHELSAREALQERNAEVRRVMIERMGYLRFASDAGAQIRDQDHDPGGPRQLLSIDLSQDEPLVGLVCRCPSTGRQYLMRVPPALETCHQAAAWIAGFDDPQFYRPLIET